MLFSTPNRRVIEWGTRGLAPTAVRTAATESRRCARVERSCISNAPFADAAEACGGRSDLRGAVKTAALRARTRVTFFFRDVVFGTVPDSSQYCPRIQRKSVPN